MKVKELKVKELIEFKKRPFYKWTKAKTTLKDINASSLHYVKVPENHIVIDFDIPGKNGVHLYCQSDAIENLYDSYCKEI